MRLANTKKSVNDAVQYNFEKAPVDTNNSLELFILQLCPPVKSASVLELGYGDSSIAMQLKKRGAREIFEIDHSIELESSPSNLENIKNMTINYGVGGISNIDAIATHRFDLVIAVSVFNDLDSTETTKIIQQVKRVLKPGGKFIFAVPHPFRPVYSEHYPASYIKKNNLYYISDLDKQIENGISIFEGGGSTRRGFHKTVSDYFDSLRFAHFTQLPDMYELMKSRAILEISNTEFSSVLNQPLHLIFSIQA